MFGLMPGFALSQEYAVTCSVEQLFPMLQGSQQGSSSHSVTNSSLNKNSEDKKMVINRRTYDQWTVPQLSIMIIYKCTWSILI